MEFRTELDIAPRKESIDYRSRIFAVGSCFAANIGAKLAAAKFNVAVNPFGEMFNPLSVAECVRRLASRRVFTAADTVHIGDRWLAWPLYGGFDSASQKELLQKANAAVELGADALLKSDTVIVTLGTAWVYRLALSGEVVANCHKAPQSTFQRVKLSVEECAAALTKMVEGEFAGKRVILTVSPVRHLGDGLTDNSLSKATLRVAVDQVAAACQNVWYFPSYELLNDDLRDYRFYADDMVHPSNSAIEYIWQKFCAATMSASTLAALRRFERLSAAAAHRPLHPDSPETARFRESMLREAGLLAREFPTVDLSAETAHFSE